MKDKFDKEFENIDWDSDSELRRATGNKRGSITRKIQWAKDKKRKAKTSKRMLSQNHEKYGGIFYLRTPGNDLLEIYDREMLKLDPTSKAYSAIKPSTVFHYRYEHKYPDIIFDKSKNYGRWSYLRDQLKDVYVAKEKTYWSQVYYTRFKWLTDKPHVCYEFSRKRELDNKLIELVGQTGSHLLTCDSDEIQVRMMWRGKLAGYILEYKPGV